MRVKRTLQWTTLMVVGATAMACAPTASAATPMRVDHGFGRAGWATVPRPNGTFIDGEEDLKSVTAGPNETYFVASALVDEKFEPRGGMIEKFSSSGRPVTSFGHRARVRSRGRERLAEVQVLDDGSLIVVAAYRGSEGGVNSWGISRLHADGSRDRRFASGGSLRFKVRSTGAYALPSVYAMGRGRFGLVLRDYAKVPQENVLRVFTRDGSPDDRFGQAGVATFPYPVTDVARAAKGELLITGGDNAAVWIDRLTASGAPVSGWGSDGRAVLDNISAQGWTLGDAKSLERDGETYDFSVSGGKITAVGDSSMVTFGTWLSSGSMDHDYSWAQRLGPDGRVDLSWGINGRRSVGTSQTSEEDDTGDSEWNEAVPLPDGRIFTSHFFYGMWGMANESTLAVIPRGAKRGAPGSSKLRVNTFRFDAATVGSDGKYFFAFGSRKRQTTIFRVRL